MTSYIFMKFSTIKQNVREEWRKLKEGEEIAFITLFVNYINNLFVQDSSLWKDHVVQSLAVRFPSSLSVSFLQSLLSHVHWGLLLSRLQILLGIVWSKPLQLENSKPFQLEPSDILTFEPIVKFTHRILFEEGTIFSKMAVSHHDNAQMSLYSELAEQKFKESLAVNPTDFRSWSNWGQLLHYAALAKQEVKISSGISDNFWQSLAGSHDPDQVKKLFDQALEKFREALKIEFRDLKTWTKYGNCLYDASKAFGMVCLHFSDICSCQTKDVSLHLLSGACQAFENAVKLCTNLANHDELAHIYYNLANAHLAISRLCDHETTLSHLSQASNFYSKSYELKSDSVELLKNWAVCLAKLARQNKNSQENYKESFQKYQLAAQLKPNGKYRIVLIML
jgi:hypothetical protein